MYLPNSPYAGRGEASELPQLSDSGPAASQSTCKVRWTGALYPSRLQIARPIRLQEGIYSVRHLAKKTYSTVDAWVRKHVRQENP